VAPAVPLARGWERQLDTADNPIFYRPGALNAATYRRWLLANGVRYVALPDAPLDFSGLQEADLVRAGVSGLRLAWRNRHWRVYLFGASRGLVSGPAHLEAVDGSSLKLRATASGVVLVRYRYNSDWVVATGSACVGRSPGGRIQLTVPHAEQISLTVSLFGKGDGSCRSKPATSGRPPAAVGPGG
jgi:hypothetical protein